MTEIKKESPTADVPKSKIPRLKPNARRFQSFFVVWLDFNIDEVDDDDCSEAVAKLREVVKDVHILTDVDACIDFITDIEQDKVFLISSSVFAPTIMSVVDEIPQIDAMYVFDVDARQTDHETEHWLKFKGVFTDITLLCAALKQKTKRCDQNSVPISLIGSVEDVTNKNLDQLDQSFMYTQIFKEILLEIDFDQQHVDNFIKFCREHCEDNKIGLENLSRLEYEYREHAPIWWYTIPSFLYSMLNRALRVMEIDLIVYMGFFIADLHRQIVTLHSEQNVDRTSSTSITVYRGQGLSQKDFDKLTKLDGGLLSFNSFLSTSLDRSIALVFAESNADNSDTVGLLFHITADPDVTSTTFANVHRMSYFQDEDEILFSMHSVFRIGNIKECEESRRVWEVSLTLTSDTDPQLHALTQHIRKETSGSTGWFRLSRLMIALGQFSHAEALYKTLLQRANSESEKRHLYLNLAEVKYRNGEYAAAIIFFEKSILNENKVLLTADSDLLVSYSGIDLAYDTTGNSTNALLSFEETLENENKTLPSNHIHLILFYINIAMVCDEMGEYSKALSYYEKPRAKLPNRILSDP